MQILILHNQNHCSALKNFSTLSKLKLAKTKIQLLSNNIFAEQWFIKKGLLRAVLLGNTHLVLLSNTTSVAR